MESGTEARRARGFFIRCKIAGLKVAYCHRVTILHKKASNKTYKLFRNKKYKGPSRYTVNGKLLRRRKRLQSISGVSNP